MAPLPPTSLLSNELPSLETALANVTQALSDLVAMGLKKSKDKNEVIRAARDFTDLAGVFVSAVVLSSPRQQPHDSAFLSVAAVIVACEIFEGVVTIIKGYATQSANKAPNLFGRMASSVSQAVGKLTSSDPVQVPKRALESYSEAMRTLMQILHIDHLANTPKCLLIEDPALGRTQEAKKPIAPLFTAGQAAQEQSQFALRLLACIFEGADVLAPLKAACLALHEIVRHIEKACTVHEQQNRLIKLIESWWKRMRTLYDQVGDSPALRNVFTVFHCDMLRITVELTMVDKSKITSALTAETVLEFIRGKERNLQDAEWTVVVSTMTVTAGDVTKISERLLLLDTTLQEKFDHVRTGLQGLLQSLERAERARATHRKFLVGILVGLLACGVGVLLQLHRQRSTHAAVMKTSDIVDASRTEQQQAFEAVHTNFEYNIELHSKTHKYLESFVVQYSARENTTSSRQFSKPGLVRGRDREIRTVVDAILALPGANIAILGPGGIGKTTVVLAAFYHAEVKQRFDNRLYSVSSEAALDANALMADIGRVLNLPSKANMLPEVIRYFESQPPSLLFIDNVETIWISNDQNVASGAEDAFRSLASIPHLTLVVTIRGTDAPSIFSARSRFHIPALSLEDARSMFADIAPDYPNSEASATDELLRAVDGVPLAIELLARLSAIPGTTPSLLLERWNDCHLDILEAELNGVHKSISRSVNVSLSFLPDKTKDPEPLQLLALSSQLPDGLQRTLFQRLKAGRSFHHINKAAQTLELHALMYRDPAGTYRSLGPIRLYVSHVYSPAPAQYDAMLKIYFDIAWKARTRGTVAPNESAENAAGLIREYANIKSVLLRHAQGGLEISLGFLEAVLDITGFGNERPSSCLLVHACLDRLMPNGREMGKADHITRPQLMATYMVGMCYARRFDVERAMEYLERTSTLASAGTPDSAHFRAQSNLDMGILLLEARPDDAIVRLQLAATLYSSLGLRNQHMLAMSLIAAMPNSRADSSSIVGIIRECDKFMAQSELGALSCFPLIIGADLDADQLAAVEPYLDNAQALMMARSDVDGVALCLDFRIRIHCKGNGCDGMAQKLIAEARALVRLPHITKTAEARLAPILATDLIFQGKLEEALALVEKAAIVAKARGMQTTLGRVAIQAKVLKEIMGTNRRQKSS